MIFHFSGTGNSEWAAQQLAHLTDDEAYDITNLKESWNAAKAKQIGFVFPVYVREAPELKTSNEVIRPWKQSECLITKMAYHRSKETKIIDRKRSAWPALRFLLYFFANTPLHTCASQKSVFTISLPRWNNTRFKGECFFKVNMTHSCRVLML